MKFEFELDFKSLKQILFYANIVTQKNSNWINEMID